MFAYKVASGGHLSKDWRLKFDEGQHLEHDQPSGELEMVAEIQHMCCSYTWCA